MTCPKTHLNILQFRVLSNQNLEQTKATKTATNETKERDDDDNEEQHMMPCRVVMWTLFSFHYSPCLERLMARSGNHQTIAFAC